jgi:hypothetical protein
LLISARPSKAFWIVRLLAAKSGARTNRVGVRKVPQRLPSGAVRPEAARWLITERLAVLADQMDERLVDDDLFVPDPARDQDPERPGPIGRAPRRRPPTGWRRSGPRIGGDRPRLSTAS